MKTDEEESDPFVSNLPTIEPNKPRPSVPNDDKIVLGIIFSMLIYCILSLTQGTSIFYKNQQNQLEQQTLLIGNSQVKVTDQINSTAEQSSWFTFPDLNQSIISQAIRRKQLEASPPQWTLEEKREKIRQKQRLKDSKLAFFREKSQLSELQSTKHIVYNLGDDSMASEIQQLNIREEFIYKLRYQIDKHPQELPFCVVAYSRDYQSLENEYEPLLRSIYNQKYSNYRIIFIADSMSPENLLSLYKFIKKSHYQKKIQVIEHISKKGYAKSVLKALKSSCKFAKIGVIINGNDQLITQNVFSIYNSVYQQKQPKVIYGNYYEYLPKQKQLYFGSSSKYTQEQLQASSYRQSMPKVGPLLSFDLTLAPFIDQSYFRSDESTFYQWQDLSFKALSYQLLQLSCGKVEFIAEYQYLSRRAQLQRKQFIKQVHMKPRRCYQYEIAK